MSVSRRKRGRGRGERERIFKGSEWGCEHFFSSDGMGF